MPKRTLQGVVVSDEQDKTVVVRVERRYTHPVMKKTVRRTKKYYAHDETNEYSVGDIVRIEERRPISRLKRWAVIEGEKKKTGEVVSIDEESGTIDIRRSMEWDGAHPASLVQIKWVPPVAMRDSLMRFGNWVAANGIAAAAPASSVTKSRRFN